MALNVPNLRQISDYDCGVIALQTVLGYYGFDTTEEELLEKLNTTEEGTSPDDLMRVAKEYGLKAICGHNLTLDVLRKAVSKGYPVIVPLQAWSKKKKTLDEWKNEWDEGHWVTVIGFQDDIVVFEDPSAFRREWLPLDEFLARWHDIDKHDVKYENYGILLYGGNPMNFNEADRMP